MILALGCTPPGSDTGGGGNDGGNGPDDELETVDVEPGLSIDTTNDPQGVDRGGGLAGVLPADFPDDLPLYLPASLVDFAETDDGRLTVTLLTPDDIAKVRRDLREKLEAAGWQTSTGADGATVLTRGGRRAWLYLERATTATLYRYEYRR